MQDAEAAYRKIVECSPDHYRYWSDLGVLLIEMGRNMTQKHYYGTRLNLELMM
ncbi:MAG: hypothetical protein OEV85_08200 [Candidatus Thorarchaeota archaeon]|nr:hypothetical protein [Candidatus Thorarchaeota archaeon]